jgi:adenylate kinase
MLAPPGAGKGTVGELLARHYGVEHVSSGDILRAEIAAGSPIGRAVAEHVRAGDLVPDDLLVGLLRDRLVAAARAGGYLLDGVPRTLSQAQTAHEIAKQFDITVQAVVHLDADEATLTERLLARGHAQGRSDDTPETIRHRLAVYQEQTQPLVAYYRNRDVLAEVDARPPVDAVAAAAVAAVDRLNSRL